MTEKIAIIGMSALFPSSKTTDEFWDNMMEKKDLTDMATKEDFGAEPEIFYQDKKGVIDKCYSLRGGYIRDFNFSQEQYGRNDLSSLDKIYKWGLHVSKDALENAGYWKNKKALDKCGVIFGNLSFPTGSSHKVLSPLYTKSMEKGLQSVLRNNNFHIPSTKYSIPKNNPIEGDVSQLVKNVIGVKATNYDLDAACASSLYAIKMACDELNTGKADMMMAGAISSSDQLFIHMGFSIFHAYAPHNKKYSPLDKDSSGLVSSEGAGMLILKRLSDAERDNDNIIGVIAGVGLSNDGAGKFVLSPNPKGQKMAYQRAYDMADKNETTYIECHATGTPLGDITEVNSIEEFFGDNPEKIHLGSVKSNMGHMLTAAGMPSLMKVLLSMQHNVIPPGINLDEAIDSDGNWFSKDQVIQDSLAWKDKHKQAAVNSFGFGGTNAHLVVENYVRNANLPISKDETKNPKGDIAMHITSMQVHFGECNNLSDYYNAIYSGKQYYSDMPTKRWKGFEENHELMFQFGLDTKNKLKGNFIDNFPMDLMRYKIQPNEIDTFEPQQALILKVADEAIAKSQLQKGQNVAVIVAMNPELAIHNYLARWDSEWQLDEALQNAGIELSAQQHDILLSECRDILYKIGKVQTPSQHTSFVGNVMASRISALWDFNGPSFTVCNGNNGTARSLEIAQNMLSLDEVDAVVVGAVDFSGGMESVLLHNLVSQINRNERPSLSYNVNNYAWMIGEGAAAMVLQTEDTLSDEDNVYASISSIGDLSLSEDISYQELIASGFKNEDSDELSDLKNMNPKQSIALGSVKANIGNTFAAASLASIIKTALCVKHKFIPATPNWSRLADDIRLASNYYIPSKSQPWFKNGNYPRTALVNLSANNRLKISEYSGVNATTNIVDEASDVTINKSAVLHESAKAGINNFLDKYMFVLQADTKDDLKESLNILLGEITSHNLSETSHKYYLSYRQNKLKYKIVFIANEHLSLLRDIKFLSNNLDSCFANNKEIKLPSGTYFNSQPSANKGDLAFVYPGSATTYEGLGRDLFQFFPDLLSHYEKILPNIKQVISSEYLYPETQSIDQAKVSIQSDAIAMMSSGVLFSTFYTHILQEYFAVNPKAVLGYSMGECSSMWYAQGLWHHKNANIFRQSEIFKNRFSGKLELLAEKWNISSDEAKKLWHSWIILLPKEELKENLESLISTYDRLEVSFYNSNKELIISGDKAQGEELIAKLKCKSIDVPFQNIIHSDMCKEEYQGLIEMHNFPLESQSSIDFYSSLTGEKIPFDSRSIAENSTAVCYKNVNFPKHIKNISSKGYSTFVELGPGNTCTSWIKDTLDMKEHSAVAIDKKGNNSVHSVFECLAQLISNGIEVDISILYQNDVAKAKKVFTRDIQLGGDSIYKRLSSDSLTEQFENIKQTTKKDMSFVKDIYPSKDSLQRIKEEKIDMIETKLLDTKQDIAENGLKLQDYNDPKHLDGKKIVFTKEDLVEFAEGKIGNVFGAEYNVIDSYKRRVMLPMDPYLLVSRVTGLRANVGEFKPSTMQTEYDIPYNSGYSTDSQIPWAVSVESGQCDLMLISYLGIDFQNKGEYVYRLLDCTLTFLDDLPFEGQTLRYDISINSFVRNGRSLLFFFSYECFVEDRMVLKMTNGCAGFFTDEELSLGNGVVYTQAEKDKLASITKQKFIPLLNTQKTSFDIEDLRHLINGDAHKCFDDISYFPNGRNESIRLAPEKMLMIDRITKADINGGDYGLGEIIAEKDLSPDDWYFPCHFRDDQVLAGSLQAEGGGNLLRFFMMMLGLQRLKKDARFQPIYGMPQKVRCRKEVTPQDSKLIYRLVIKDIGLLPDPYVVGDLEIIVDGVITVHFENLGLQIREKDNPKYLETEKKITNDALLNENDIETFALGRLADCFGDEYKVYDNRSLSRQPNTDLQVLSRVMKIDGERFNFSKPSHIWTEYDVPADVWYYKQNSSITMPYSILMEIALQPCGLLGAYLGSTLQFADKDLYFRNLDGDGETFDLPLGTNFAGKVVKNKSTLLTSTSLGGFVIQKYNFEVSVDGHVFYKGSSSFGFFPKEALAQQVGLDNGKDVPAWYVQQNKMEKDYFQFNLDSLYAKMKLYKSPADKPYLRLAADQLNLIDKGLIIKDGGEFNKGYIHCSKAIHTYDWFFTCHFYSDPVMPGSLGVEAIHQAMQVFALQQNLAKDFKNPRFVQVENNKTEWKYRGQIKTNVDNMHLEVHFKSVKKQGKQLVILANAYLWNEATRIYQLTDIALAIEEA